MLPTISRWVLPLTLLCCLPLRLAAQQNNDPVAIKYHLSEEIAKVNG